MAYLQTIHESFDEDDMNLLRKAKGSMTWKEFTLNAAKIRLQSPDPAGNFFQNRKPYHTPKSEIPIPADDTHTEEK